MSEAGATLLPDFSQINYPTYMPAKEKDVIEKLQDEDNLNLAYPTMEILTAQIYINYVNDPTNVDYTKHARDLFQVKPRRDKDGNLLFHVPLDSPSATRFMADEESYVPEFLEFLFLPS